MLCCVPRQIVVCCAGFGLILIMFAPVQEQFRLGLGLERMGKIKSINSIQKLLMLRSIIDCNTHYIMPPYSFCVCLFQRNGFVACLSVFVGPVYSKFVRWKTGQGWAVGFVAIGPIEAARIMNGRGWRSVERERQLLCCCTSKLLSLLLLLVLLLRWLYNNNNNNNKAVGQSRHTDQTAWHFGAHTCIVNDKMIATSYDWIGAPICVTVTQLFLPLCSSLYAGPFMQLPLYSSSTLYI